MAGDVNIVSGIPGGGTDPFVTLITDGTAIETTYDAGDRQWNIVNSGVAGSGIEGQLTRTFAARSTSQ